MNKNQKNSKAPTASNVEPASPKLDHITCDSGNITSLERFTYTEAEEAAHAALVEPSVLLSVGEFLPDVFVAPIQVFTTYHGGHASTTISLGGLPLVFMATGFPKDRSEVVQRMEHTISTLPCRPLSLREYVGGNNALCVVKLTPFLGGVAVHNDSDVPNIGNLERRLAWAILDRLAELNGKEGK